MHDRFRDNLRLTDIAAAVGVHPVHLARVFRASYGIPVGTYARGLRLTWAAGRLRDSADDIAQIALEAGSSIRATSPARSGSTSALRRSPTAEMPSSNPRPANSGGRNCQRAVICLGTVAAGHASKP